MVCCASFAVSPVWATGENSNKCNDGNFLGFKPWYDGICNESTGEILEVEGGEAGLAKFVWTIVLNISYDISLAAGFIAVALVIYGGYKYIMSQGDPGKMMSAKQSLMSAIIGVIITMGATVIVNTLKLILHISGNGWQQQDKITVDMVQGVFNWAYGVAGLVAIIFIVKNGVDYMLSAGDPGKTQKATRGLIFSVVGLVVVICASIITSFIVGTVSGAM